jgi:hypothetical protein
MESMSNDNDSGRIEQAAVPPQEAQRNLVTLLAADLNQVGVGAVTAGAI